MKTENNLTEIDTLNINGLLNEADGEIIKGLTPELKKTFENKEIMRTEFLARTSVLNNTDFPDQNAKFWQSVREQDAQLNALVIDSFTYKKTLAEIEIIEAELNEIIGNDKKTNAQRKLKLIEIDEKKFLIINLKLSSHHRVRELALWEKIKNECIKQDPSFDRNNVETNQAKSFKLKWEKQKFIATQTNNSNLYRSVISHLDTLGEI